MRSALAILAPLTKRAFALLLDVATSFVGFGYLVGFATGVVDELIKKAADQALATSGNCQRRRKSRPRRRCKTRPVGEDVRHGERASHIACACHGALARQGQ